ncbi:MAG TPA: 3-oxoacyl-[acyl-carrier-protein] synthase III C-terminal domain-containing protein [Acidimicrobiales bacterium]|nr:3-oxoacyl-[acyl-carrier-protein] synthase III C-terminal domain-containing protein [Acidimicrobiales bacterium]
MAETEARWLLMEAGGSDAMPFRARIESVGRRLPEDRVTTEAVMRSTRHRTRIDLERLTGIRERRWVGDGEDSATLAIDAARDCLRRSAHAAEDLDVLIVCSITKYRDGLAQQMEPPLSHHVRQAIGADRAQVFDLSNACAGLLTGMFVLNDWIRRGQVRCGMVVSGEDISSLARNAAKHVRHILSKELASLTLGDAGAAAIVDRAPEGSEGITAAGFTTLAAHSRLCLAQPSEREPGARMRTDSRGIHRAAIEDLPPLLREALDAAGLQLHDIDWVVPHQTSARAIRKGMAEVAQALGDEPRHPAVVTVDRFGNTASTTHVVALVEMLEDGRLRAGDRVALVALASGLEVGVLVVTVDEHLAGRDGHDA